MSEKITDNKITDESLEYDLVYCEQCDTINPQHYHDVHRDRRVIRCSICHHILHTLQPGEQADGAASK